MPRGRPPVPSASSTSILALAAALLASGAALGDDAALARCRAIADPAARLACYDALAPATEAKPGSSSAAPAAAGAPAQPAAAPPQSPAAQFGLERKVAPPKDLPDQIDTRIAGRFEGWWPSAVIQLANGQVWQFIDSDSRYYDLDSPKVTITRGVLGAFYFNVDGDNHTALIRRVK